MRALIFFNAGSNQSLDPAEPQSTSGLAQLPLIAIYDSLIGHDDLGNLIPRLATEWHSDAGMTEFTMTLRAGVTFHNGTTFDAAAVVANIARSKALGLKAGTSVVDAVRDIVSVDAIDARTVRLRLRTPSGQMPYLLAAQGGMMIAPASLTDAGYPNSVDVSWLLLNTSEYQLLGQAIQAMVGEVGSRLKFDVVSVSQYTLFRAPPHRGDIFMGRWGGRGDPLQTFQEVGGAGGSVNAGGAVVPEIDALVKEGRLLDPSNPRRTEILHRLSRVMTEQVSQIIVMTRANVYAFRPGCIQNLTPYLPTGSDRINDVRVGAGCK